MPRYHFQITDGTQVLKAPHGVELPGNAAAREEAVRLAQDAKAGDLGPPAKWDGWFVRVTDAHGHEVETVPIDAVPDGPLAP